MKLLRAMIALALLASVSTASVAAAQAGSSVSWTTRSDQRGLSSASVTAETPAAATPEPVAPVALPSAATTTAPTDTGRVIVGLKDSATPSVLSAVAKSAETSTGAAKQFVRGQFEWRVPKGRSAKQFAAQLEKTGRVDYAVPDYVRQPVYDVPAYPAPAPNDPDFNRSTTGASYYGKTLVAQYPYGRSWWLRDIKAPSAWEQGYTGSDIVGKYPLRASGTTITVAVIDSGLYPGPDNAVNVTGGHDFFQSEPYPGAPLVEDNDVTPVDPTVMSRSLSWSARVSSASHGTCVSGEIGATADNSLGSLGVGYDTHVVVHKVMGFFSNGSVGIPDSAVIAAIHYSVDVDHAKVINMSFGDYQSGQALQPAIDYAYSHGCILVAAKGNDNSSRAFYPACNNHVISVGALDKNANEVTIPADYTNYSKTSLDLMAPGTFIWGLTMPGQNLVPGLTVPGYYVWDGTSMAAPVVAGAVAWLWRAAPALSNAEITSEVLNSAPKGPKSTRFPSGYRKLDMTATYARLKADYPLLVKPAIVDQTVASLGSVPISWGVPMAKQRGVTYDVTVNGTSEGATTNTGQQSDWTTGTYTVAVQAHSSYNWDDGTARSQGLVNVVDFVDGIATWAGAHVAGSSATLATPGYGQTVAIDVALKDAAGTALSGAAVRLQSSSNGATFADVAGAAVNLPSGVYRSAVSPRSRTWYRFAFSGHNGITGSVSAAAVVIPGVSLTTPSAKSSISHTKKLTASGKLVPAHRSSSRTVKLKIQRWNGHRWADYSWVWTRVTWRSSSYSTYSASFRLRKGGYRLYAYAPADAQHSATTSGYKAVTVK